MGLEAWKLHFYPGRFFLLKFFKNAHLHITVLFMKQSKTRYKLVIFGTTPHHLFHQHQYYHQQAAIGEINFFGKKMLCKMLLLGLYSAPSALHYDSLLFSSSESFDSITLATLSWNAFLCSSVNTNPSFLSCLMRIRSTSMPRSPKCPTKFFLVDT